jgi:hypothetical protein
MDQPIHGGNHSFLEGTTLVTKMFFAPLNILGSKDTFYLGKDNDDSPLS